MPKIPDLGEGDECHESQHEPEKVAIIIFYLWRMAEVLSENTGDEGNRHKDGSDDSELFHHFV